MLQDGQQAARVKAAAAVDQESPTYGLSMRHAADSRSHHLTRGEDGRDYLPQPIVLRPGDHLGKWKPPQMRTMYTRVLALLDMSSLF